MCRSCGKKLPSWGLRSTARHDPMTIVARGAAIYAASRPMPESISARAQAPKTGLRVQLEYVPVVKSETSPVGGKISTADGSSPAGGTAVDDQATRWWLGGRFSGDRRSRIVFYRCGAGALAGKWV